MKKFVLTCLLLSLSTLTFAKVDTHNSNYRSEHYQRTKSQRQYQTNAQPSSTQNTTDQNHHQPESHQASDTTQRATKVTPNKRYLLHPETNTQTDPVLLRQIHAETYKEMTTPPQAKIIH